MLEMLSASREVILLDKRRSRINLQQGKFRLNIMKNVVTVRSLKQSSRLSGETVKAGSDTFLSVLVGRIINKHFSVKGEWHRLPQRLLPNQRSRRISQICLELMPMYR